MGTMFQLRNLIHRKNVPMDPQNNVNAAEDFLLLLLHTHTVAAAKVLMSLTPTESAIELARAVVVNYVCFPRISHGEYEECSDKVYVHSTELLSLSIIWHGFHDTVRERDGDRILRYWKLLLVIFKSTNKYNYAKEAVILLMQYYYLFSDRQRQQLLWSRCVNTRGVIGANIPCDLYMEHLNRCLKTMLHNLGSNISPEAIRKAGMAIAPVQHICNTFECQTAPYLHSNRHSMPHFGKDFDKVLGTLVTEKVFVPIREREFTIYKHICTVIEKHSTEELKQKMEHSLKQLNFSHN